MDIIKFKSPHDIDKMFHQFMLHKSRKLNLKCFINEQGILESDNPTTEDLLRISDLMQWFSSDDAKSEFENFNRKIQLYPEMSDQLDLLYWDMINGSENWKNLISDIKRSKN